MNPREEKEEKGRRKEEKEEPREVRDGRLRRCLTIPNREVGVCGFGAFPLGGFSHGTFLLGDMNPWSQVLITANMSPWS